jgi:phytoene dehydrogenase-like protein
MKRVGIVGAGHNALVASCYLAAAGFSVSVFERAGIVGGLCTNEEIFPGIVSSPVAMRYGMLRQRVIRDLGLVKRGLSGFRAPYATTLLSNGDGVNFMLGTRDNNVSKFDIMGLTTAHMESWNQLWQDAGRASRILSERQTTSDYSASHFADELRSGGSARLAEHLFDSSLIDLAESYGLHPSLVAVVANMCFCHPALPQSVMEFLYFGTSESFSNLGEWGFVMGGMGRITELLAEEAAARGVSIRVNAPVKKIVAEEKGAISVVLASGTVESCDIVLSGATPTATAALLDESVVADDSGMARRGLASQGLSHAIFHLLLDGLPDSPRLRELGRSRGQEYHGQIDLSITDGELRDGLQRYQESGEPFGERVNICINSLTALEPERAVSGRHIVSGYHFFCPVTNRGKAWDVAGEGEILRTTYSLLERSIPTLQKHLVDAKVITPTTLRDRYGLEGYSCHHAPLTKENVLSSRRFGTESSYRICSHAVYLCGAGGAPGPTVSGMPGLLCAQEVISVHGPAPGVMK